MTTNKQTAAEIAASLELHEIAALKIVASGKNIDDRSFRQLESQGLVVVKYGAGLVNQDVITDLGREVLTLLEPSAPEGGETTLTLTGYELADLQAIAHGMFDDNEDYGDDEFKIYTSLWNKGLIARRFEHTYVTDLGKRVLTAARPQPSEHATSTAHCANCGNIILASSSPLCLDCAMLKMASDPDIQREMKAIRDEEAAKPADGSERPSEISVMAWHLIEKQYNNGECIVKVQHTSQLFGLEVFTVTHVDISERYCTINHTRGLYTAPLDTRLMVFWLDTATPQPAPAPATDAVGGEAELTDFEWSALELARNSDGLKPETWINDRSADEKIWLSLHVQNFVFWDKKDCVVTITDLGKRALAARHATDAAGWYYSSVAQWMPEYSTEKIMNYDGPFPKWQDALSALFAEIAKDEDEDRKELATLRATVAEQAAIISNLEAQVQAAGKLAEAVKPMIFTANNLLGGLFKTTVSLDDGGWVDAYFDPYEDQDGKALDRAVEQAAAALESWQATESEEAK